MSTEEIINTKTIPFYSYNTPALHSFVIAEVVEFSDTIVHCVLPEYANHPAILMTTEIGMKRGKRVKDYVKPKLEMAVLVLSIEQEEDKSILFLSMKNINEKDKKDAFSKYHDACKANLVLFTAADYKKEEAEELYTYIRNKITSSELTVNSSSSEEMSVFRFFEKVLLEEEKVESEKLLKAIQLRLPPPSVTLEKEIFLRSLDSDGVQKIRQKLDEYASMPNVKVFVVSPPKYKIMVTSTTRQKAEEMLLAF
jgi:translation initiation factor 2 alpha subunit (eIF-2alpha)